ncbi:MAG: anti-sigma factor [Mycobacteriales bacterium]
MAYAMDTGDEPERPKVQRHLRECSSCMNEIATLAGVGRVLLAGSEAAPPPELRERIIAAVRQTPQIDSAPQTTPREIASQRFAPREVALRFKRRRGGFTLAMAMAAVLLTFFVGSLLTERDTPNSNTADSPPAIVKVLQAQDAVARSVSTDNGGALTVTTSVLNKASVAVMSRLAEPPPGHVYQLWLIGPHNVRSAGISSSGSAQQLVPRLEDATTIGLTIEPSGGSEQPTTDPVLVAPLR